MTDATDTSYNMDWNDFLNVIQTYGFEVISNRKFASPSNHGTQFPTMIVAAHREKKLLLTATSFIRDFNGEELCEGTVYGALINQAPTDEEVGFHYYSRYLSTIARTEFYIIITTNLLARLEKIGEKGVFTDWQNVDRYVNLLDYVERQKLDIINNDFYVNAYRDGFISGAPKWVREFILPYEAFR